MHPFCQLALLLFSYASLSLLITLCCCFGSGLLWILSLFVLLLLLFSLAVKCNIQQSKQYNFRQHLTTVKLMSFCGQQSFLPAPHSKYTALFYQLENIIISIHLLINMQHFNRCFTDYYPEALCYYSSYCSYCRLL